MRILIVVTCCAVLAAVGYFFAQGYRSDSAARKAEEAAAWRRICQAVAAGEYKSTPALADQAADECIRRKGRGEL